MYTLEHVYVGVMVGETVMSTAEVVGEGYVVGSMVL